MRVVVTGASGFAGGFIARALAETGFEVTALARRNDVKLPASAEARERFRVHRADLVDGIDLPLSQAAVIHAGATSPWKGVADSTIMLDNVVATRRLVRHAQATGVERFIFFSSMSAFGPIDVPAVDENVASRPSDAYGMSKLTCEEILREQVGPMASIALRLPGIVGPGAHRNFLAETARKARAGQSITYFNPEAPFNNAVHIADLAIFVTELLKRQRWQGADMVVLGAAGRMPVREAVSSLCLAIDPGARLQEVRQEKRSFVIDSTKAQAAYGYRPMHIRDVLERFAEEARRD